MATHTSMLQGSSASVRSNFEQRIGILHFVSSTEHGWHGQTRTRYTDFQVHEIDKDGQVIHLHDYPTTARDLAKAEASHPAAQDSHSSQATQAEAPKPETHAEGSKTSEVDDKQESTASEAVEIVTPSDKSTLTELLGGEVAEELVALYEKYLQDQKALPRSLGRVRIPALSDKTQRSRIHSEIRRIFNGKIDTTTDSDGSIKAVVIGSGKQRWGTRAGNDRSRTNNRQGQGQGLKYLHFSLYKENRDTLDAIGHIARQLNMKPSFFGTAGTKDKRAVTVQRVSIRARNPQSLLFLNIHDRVRGVKIGDFAFAKDPIELGGHSGNEFVIVLKNCSFDGTEGLEFEDKLNVARSTLDSALQQVVQHGFINYYGTQRFGTHQIGTHEVGMKILKGHFEEAIKALLAFDGSLLDGSNQDQSNFLGYDDVARARACSIFLSSGDSEAALKLLPKRCNVEFTIIRQLGKQPKDFAGALTSISRGMRTMYLHAYQSFVWNYAASERWKRFGDKVIEGDLVLIKSSETSAQQDEEGDMAPLLAGDPTTDHMRGLVAHTLSEEEARSGKYSVFDVVLPSPGWDVVYPNNAIGQFYRDFMQQEANGALDPHNMRRPQKDFSLPGTYRKLMGKIIGTPEVSVRAYSNDVEQLVPTDLDLIRARKAKEVADRRAPLPKEPSENSAVRQKAASAWSNFTLNVRENELKESRQNIERRKAEDPVEASGSRMADTWVQTSVDGSKRVKVAAETVDVGSSNKAASAADAIAIDHGKEHGTRNDLDIDNAQGGGVHMEGAEDAQPGAQEHAGTGNSMVAVTIQQVRAAGSTFTSSIMSGIMRLIHLLLVSLRITTDKTHAKPKLDTLPAETVPQSQTETVAAIGSSDTHTKPQQPVEPAGIDTKPTYEPLPQIDVLPPAITSEPPVPNSQQATEPTADKPQNSSGVEATIANKIAVILRFSLDTSQYATIVLRELQGGGSEESAGGNQDTD
ncbi:pseudouridine synthase [Xylariomycetidae sp. FL2044]|nr:pseudouridine synthase [Xylariomycetidae sp. FL2044]